MLNRVTLIGRLGKDPAIKHFSNDNMGAEFTLATDDSYKNKEGQKVEQTDWHNIKIFGKLAGIVERYLKKGSQVYVEGKIKTRSYDDKDGNKKYITEIIVDTLKMLDGKNREQEGHSEENANVSSGNSGSSNPVEEDLPF